jgi:ABC-type lipoprotein release transport system permease subunit
MEAGAMMLAATPLGLVLGLITARYLNSILARFPGVPERIDFFLFQPRSAWTALGLLALSGVLAAVYPSWRSASLPIATTLRQEAVGLAHSFRYVSWCASIQWARSASRHFAA